MRTPRANENFLKLLVFALIALMAIFELIARRGLFADGAYFLTYILDRQIFLIPFDKLRIFSYWFTQFPTVIAVRLGVTNLPLLTYLFSSWLILAPLLFWGMALGKLVNDILFWPFLALFTLVFLNANFFIIGEYNLSYALIAYCFASMIRGQKESPVGLGLLMGAAFILIMTYPLTMLSAPLLAFIALKHMRKADPKHVKLYWLILFGFFVAAGGVGFWGFLFPGNLANKTNAMDFHALLFDRQAWITALCVSVIFLQTSICSKHGKDAAFIIILAVEALIALGIFHPFPYVAYSVRGFMGIFLFLSLTIMMLAKMPVVQNCFKQHRIEYLPSIYFYLPIFILFAELVIFDMRDSFAYGKYVGDFTRMVNGHSGYMMHGDSMAAVKNDRQFGWTWTYPSMSLVLRENARKAIVLNPPEGVSQQFFNPFTGLPDLTRYYGS